VTSKNGHVDVVKHLLSDPPAFGQGSATAPAYGQSSSAAVPSFGQTSATVPAFGQPSSTPTPALGPTPGMGFPASGQANSAPQFGQAMNSRAFGQFATSAPAFRSPNFGQNQAFSQSSAAPVFGGSAAGFGDQQSTFTFGTQSAYIRSAHI
jgi:nucleoporin NUP159